MAVSVRRQAFFLDSPRGPLFCVHTAPDGAALGRILYAPPFAEEMNKSRRMASLAARAFALKGWSVLQVDLCGTGDSAGDFADTAWMDWIEDLAIAWQWLEGQADGRPVVWSLRAGSLLAAELVRRLDERPMILLWQPVFNGRQHLTQFLRLKGANEMLAEADAGAAISAAREALNAGRSVEVAGYEVGSSMAQGLEAAVFSLPPAYSSAVRVFELAPGQRAELSPGLANQLRRLSEAGVSAYGELVPGAPFWGTQEIEEVPELIQRSVAVLDGWLA